MSTIYIHDGNFGAQVCGTRDQFRAALAPVFGDWHRDADTDMSLDEYIEHSLDEHLIEAGADDIDRLTSAGMAL